MCMKVVTESFQFIQIALKDMAVNHAQVFEWFCHFKVGQISITSILDALQPVEMMNL